MGRSPRGQPYQGPNKLGFGSILTETEEQKDLRKWLWARAMVLRHWADFQATCEQLS